MLATTYWFNFVADVVAIAGRRRPHRFCRRAVRGCRVREAMSLLDNEGSAFIELKPPVGAGRGLCFRDIEKRIRNSTGVGRVRRNNRRLGGICSPYGCMVTTALCPQAARWESGPMMQQIPRRLMVGGDPHVPAFCCVVVYARFGNSAAVK
ncbi:hypothetical protein OH76DRAFT_1208223 [Lentinus brumalis]|uniref:Uncharacterized protein n=1 Tax=Lentinus brumalis TaxID=2498619 RepID=A0A371DL60_9APHY|nr:hypothetical protein OH76DRAFT_1208223 [Polyporus brumalis]